MVEASEHRQLARWWCLRRPPWDLCAGGCRPL